MAWQLAVQEFRDEPRAGPWGLAGPGREGLDSKLMKQYDPLMNPRVCGKEDLLRIPGVLI